MQPRQSENCKLFKIKLDMGQPQNGTKQDVLTKGAMQISQKHLLSEEREQHWWFATWHCHACVLSESETEPSTGIISLVFPLGCYKQNQYVLMTAAVNFIMLHMITFCTYPVVGLTESNRVYPFKVVNYYKNAEPHDKIHSWMILSLGNIVMLSLSILLI